MQRMYLSIITYFKTDEELDNLLQEAIKEFNFFVKEWAKGKKPTAKDTKIIHSKFLYSARYMVMKKGFKRNSKINFLYNIGEKNMKKTAAYIEYQEGKFLLNIKLKINGKYEKKTVSLLMNKTKQNRIRQIVLAENRKYHILIKRKKPCFYQCVITYDTPDPRFKPLIYPLVGIDINKYKLSVVVVNNRREIIEHFDVDISEIYRFPIQQKDRRLNILGHKIKDLFKYLKKRFSVFSVIIGYPYMIIRFKNNRDFPYRKIAGIILSRAARMKIPIRIINESYTSRFARYLNLDNLDIHQKAAYMIILKYLSNNNTKLVHQELRRPKKFEIIF